MVKNTRPVPIGIDNFKKIIEDGYCYVDKTELIEDILTRGALVNLFPRPRRFGKTLTISMLENYFNIKKKEENKDLFKGLKVENASEKVKETRGKYPIISLNLKSVKANTWKEEFEALKLLLSKLYQANYEVYEVLSNIEKEIYNRVLNIEASQKEYEYSLKNLSEYLYRYYKQPVVILIDEYDAPIETGFINGFYDDVINFMRNFFGEALKTNDYLKFACMTGMLRISDDNLSGSINNICTFPILDKMYSEYFGFLPEEVDKLLEEYGVENKEEVKKWYDGYNFAGTKIYNPWSILNVLDSKKIQPYWVNTDEVDMLEVMLKNAEGDVKKDSEDLMQGKTIEINLNENIVYSDITGSRDNIFNFMLMCGYVTVEKQERREEHITGKIRIPNMEVKIAFRTIVNRWFEQNNARKEITDFQRAILRNDKELVGLILNQLMKKSISYFENVENFYHGFVLGLLVDMGENYIVESNRESGYGRYDMKIEKKDGSIGIILEFKTVQEEEKMEEMAEKALEQIEEKEYYLDMEKRGMPKILTYGIAFNNKKAVIK